MPRAEKIVAIHQPNFFPWLGYFDKVVRSDVFVLLDVVQFPKGVSGGNWTNRVHLLVNGRPAWFTVPIVRSYHGLRAIADIAIDESTPWRERLMRLLAQHYPKAKYFEEAFGVLRPLISEPSSRLANYNFVVICALTGILDLHPEKFILASTLDAGGHGTELLANIVKSVGGTTYLCGAGSAGYLDESILRASGVRLVYQDFRHPTYEQGETEFVSGLSIIDALMHCGVGATSGLLTSSDRA